MKLRNNKFLYKLSLNIKWLRIEEYPKTEKRHKKFVIENKTISKIKPINSYPLHMLCYASIVILSYSSIKHSKKILLLTLQKVPLIHLYKHYVYSNI